MITNVKGISRRGHRISDVVDRREEEGDVKPDGAAAERQ